MKIETIQITGDAFYYLPPGAGEDFYFATNPFDKDYIRGVDEADGPSFSGEFTRK